MEENVATLADGAGATFIQRGVYQHHKGGFYTVLGLAWIHDEDEFYVRYRGQEAERIDADELRTWTNFTEMVEWPDGKVRRRFVRIIDTPIII